MILTCQACHTSYLVDAEDIGAGGRTVRCAACGAEWFQTYTPDPDPIPDALEPVERAQPHEQPDDQDSDFDLSLPVIASSRVDYDAQLPMVRPRQEPGGGVVLLLIAILVSVGAGLFLFGERERIVSFWRPAAHAYALMGLPVEMDGFVIRDVRVERAGADVTLTGQVLNTSPFAKPAPPIKVTVRDADGAALYFTVFKPAGRAIAPSKTSRFSHTVSDLPQTAYSLEVDFTVTAPAQ